MVGERTSNHKECRTHDLPSLPKTTNVPAAKRFTCLDSKATQAVTQEKPAESSNGFSMPGQMCIWSTIPHSIPTRNTILRVRDPYLRGLQGSPCVVNSKYVNHTRKMPDRLLLRVCIPSKIATHSCLWVDDRLGTQKRSLS